MKRLIWLVLLCVVGVINISAQEIILSQENSTNARIDKLSQEVVALSQKLEKLQEDYDFLDFTNRLNHTILKMEILDKEVEISSNEILLSCYNSRFNIDFYLEREREYNILQRSCNNFLLDKDFLSTTMQSLTLSSQEQDIINILFQKFDLNLSIIKHNLQSFKNNLDWYKKKGKRFY